MVQVIQGAMAANEKVWLKVENGRVAAYKTTLKILLTYSRGIQSIRRIAGADQSFRSRY